MSLRACVVDYQALKSRSLIPELKASGFAPVFAMDPHKQETNLDLSTPTIWLIDVDHRLDLFIQVLNQPRQFVVALTANKHFAKLELDTRWWEGEILGLLQRPVTPSVITKQLTTFDHEIQRPSEIQLATDRFLNNFRQRRLKDSLLNAQFLQTHCKGQPKAFYFMARVQAELQHTYDLALVSIDKGLQIEPLAGPLLKLKIDILLKMLRYAEARPLIHLLLQEYPLDIDLQVDMMNVARFWKDYPLAVQILETILRHESLYQVADWDSVGMAGFHLSQDLAAAIQDVKLKERYLKAITDMPLSDPQRITISEELMSHGDLEGAEKLLTQHPHGMSASAYAQLGRIYFEAKNLKFRALEIWKEGYALTHDDMLFDILQKHHTAMGLKFSLS